MKNNVYDYFDFDKYNVNVFLSKHGYKNKPTTFQASTLNNAFHQNFVYGSKKIKSTALLKFVKHISKNGISIASTGTKTKTIFIDIDAGGNSIFNFLSNNEKSDNFSNLSIFFNIFTPSFWYETSSSTQENRRLRLVYLFFESINKSELEEFVEQLAKIFTLFGAVVDVASKNIKQLWFGTNKQVFSYSKTRIFHIGRSLELLDYFIWKFGLNLFKFDIFQVNFTSILQPKIDLNLSLDEVYEEYEDYENALWLYVGLFHISKTHLLKTKPKWKKKFYQTMSKKPFFKPKKNTLGFNIYFSSEYKTKQI